MKKGEHNLVIRATDEAGNYEVWARVIAPTVDPELNRPAAKARSFLGNHSATVLIEAGKFVMVVVHGTFDQFMGFSNPVGMSNFRVGLAAR